MEMNWNGKFELIESELIEKLRVEKIHKKILAEKLNHVPDTPDHKKSILCRLGSHIYKSIEKDANGEYLICIRPNCDKIVYLHFYDPLEY